MVIKKEVIQMNEEKVKERLEDLIDTCNQGIEMYPYDKELFKTDKKALETILQLLEQKDKRIDELEKALILKSLENQERIDKEITKLERECWEEIDKELFKNSEYEVK